MEAENVTHGIVGGVKLGRAERVFCGSVDGVRLGTLLFVISASHAVDSLFAFDGGDIRRPTSG